MAHCSPYVMGAVNVIQSVIWIDICTGGWRSPIPCNINSMLPSCHIVIHFEPDCQRRMKIVKSFYSIANKSGSGVLRGNGWTQDFCVLNRKPIFNVHDMLLHHVSRRSIFFIVHTDSEFVWFRRSLLLLTYYWSLCECPLNCAPMMLWNLSRIRLYWRDQNWKQLPPPVGMCAKTWTLSLFRSASSSVLWNHCWKQSFNRDTHLAMKKAFAHQSTGNFCTTIHYPPIVNVAIVIV